MKIFFKILSLALVFIMLFSSLFACEELQLNSDSPDDEAADDADLENEEPDDEEKETENSQKNESGDGGFSIPQKVLSDDTTFTEGVFRYAVYDDDTAVIIEHTGNELEIVVPDTLGGYPVVAIGSGAFYENAIATSVKFGSKLEIIGSSAFNGCQMLEKVEIPETVWAIYPDAFTDTPWYKSLTKDEFVIVGDSVLLKYNGNDTKVVIPDTVKHLSAVFLGNETIKDVTIPDSVYTVGCAAFSSSTVTRVTLGKNIVMLDDSAFAYCYDLHYINMPDSLKHIGPYAFVSCTGLNYIKIGKNVETIDAYAFYRASRFSCLYLPKSIKTIGDYAFEDCYYFNYLYYEGSEADFEALGLVSANSKLLDINKFYNYDYSGGIYEAQQ